VSLKKEDDTGQRAVQGATHQCCYGSTVRTCNCHPWFWLNPSEQVLAPDYAALSGAFSGKSIHLYRSHTHTWNHAPHSTTVNGQDGMRVLRLTFLFEDALWGGLGPCSLSSSNPHRVAPAQVPVQQLLPWHRRHLAALPAAEARAGFYNLQK
jgi:hypothetical protein